MIPRLYHASSRLFVSTRVHHDARLTFSSSAISFVRRPPQRSAGERANLTAVGRQLGETEDAVEENETNTDESKEDEELDRWLLAGEKKVNESGIRSYKNPYEHFIKNVAPSFREPSPRNWLGRDVPFPLNPSFKPPIPLSDGLRTRLYRAYMIDPKLNSVRALAARHNISIKRVDAILRLKGMEESWKKVPFVSPGTNSYKSGSRKGMERLLGVAEAAKRKEQDNEFLEDGLTGESDRPDSDDRYDVEEADLQDEDEGNNRTRQRYQRLFWESVAEGEEPVMSDVLAAQRGATSARTKFKGKTTLVERAQGRPAIMFTDVGNAFVDEREKERRESEGARRSTLKARKRMRKQLSHH
ncbi:eukaryotic mitochondrial regulator protein-domain-containing protein [Boletus edulis BED1]|uniref:Eukaryotic mitochondrial regulator protein-domain-containing protein n=1 Tax=Boletus edulis BED1 TaxID=1328754 RepID=A0AAD4BL22_BOLED|nr:eukaryotic mitochondrial regulator protein-domain-containing protein [Boletus edulis BED1]